MTLTARYVPTGALAVIGKVTLCGREGISRRVALSSVIYEMVLTASAATLAGSYLLIQLPALEDSFARYLIFIAAFCLTITVHPRVFNALGGVLLKRLGKDESLVRMSVKQASICWLLYLISMLWAGLGIYAFSVSLYPVDVGSIPFFLGTFSLAYIASVAAFLLPAGLGAREAVLAVTLNEVLPSAVALAVTVATRLVQLIIELLFVGFGYLHSRLTQRR